mmetsp:Transcript_22183/g.52570  ORF Transcript_22183/g.52570 Transcript_22183/m.52570 type:complete len:213 (+) Transcript_22183:967-1605(+)
MSATSGSASASTNSETRKSLGKVRMPKLRVRQSALPVRSFGFMRIINSSVCGCVRSTVTCPRILSASPCVMCASASITAYSSRVPIGGKGALGATNSSTHHALLAVPKPHLFTVSSTCAFFGLNSPSLGSKIRSLPSEPTVGGRRHSSDRSSVSSERPTLSARTKPACLITIALTSCKSSPNKSVYSPRRCCTGGRKWRAASTSCSLVSTSA